MRTLSLAVAIAVFSAMVSGCNSDSRAPIKGNVTVGGKDPLPGGSILFVSLADPTRSASGLVGTDGTYIVHNAPVGECKVLISNGQFDPSTRSKGMGGGPGGMGPPGGGMGGMMKGAPGKSAAPGSGGPSEKDKQRMSGPPKGADVPADMATDQVDFTKVKFIKLDPKFGSDDSPLRVTVTSGQNTASFDVK